MQDDRIWEFEKDLWTGSSYREKIARDALMVVPGKPHIMAGHDAADAMGKTPRWDSVEFSDQKVARPDGPQGGLIVIAYHVTANCGQESYAAHCSTTMLRQGEEDWKVVQHQQLPAAP